MTVNEVKKKYEDMFGGYPSFLLMGATDEEIIRELSACIESGKELEAPDPDADY
jgi:hypothetical protein